MMKKIFNKKTAGIGALTAILLLGVIAPSLPIATAALGETLDCNAIYYEGEWDKVEVKDGASCTIYAMNGDVTITGDITVESGSTLQLGTVNSALSGGETYTVTVEGSIKSNGGDYVRIEGIVGNLVNISGSVQITNTANGVVVNYADIGGSSQFEKNLNAYSVINSNINGNVQISDNSGSNDGGMWNNIAGNTIDGNLQCSGNDPAPQAVIYGLNTVSGNAQGQCEGLA